MAIAKTLLTAGIKGQLGKEFVFKRYGNKTVITRFPDMSNIKPTKAQKDTRSLFAQAVAYAQSINNDPELKAKYKKKVKRRQSVYQYAMQEFYRKNKGKG